MTVQELILVAFMILSGVFVGAFLMHVLLTTPITRKPHVHVDYMWDGFYSFCFCGVCSGDKHDSDGLRCRSFDAWPKEAAR